MSPLILVVPVAIILLVGWYAERTIDRYDDDLADAGLPTGEELARAILARNGAGDVRVEGGEDDLYAPRERRIELSYERVGRRSASSAALAAHESAHAIQHALRLRSFMLALALSLPALLGSLAWFPLAVAAAVLGLPALTAASFALFAFVTAVGALRTAVEIDASRRALRELEHTGIDARGARRVLVHLRGDLVADALIDFGWIGRRLGRDDDRVDLDFNVDG